MGKSAPEPPDPRQTSAAQTSTNVGTAIANSYLGNVNQYTPDGALEFDRTGTYTWYDPYTRKSYDIPRFSATQTLTPEAQRIFDTNQSTMLNLANIGKEQSGRIQDLLGTPLKLDNESTEARLWELGRKRLDPLLAERYQDRINEATARGIRPGSDAYTNIIRDVTDAENDAYNQLLLSGRGQAIQELLTERNAPINEITALMSGSQVSQPNFINAQQPQIPTTDVAGIINDAYQAKLGAWQQKSAMTSNILGGLFGLGGALIASDRRLKTDVKKIGKTDDNQPIYAYRYKGDPEPRIGLMAQDVEKKRPDAVVRMPSGYKAVDYDKALGTTFGMGAAA